MKLYFILGPCIALAFSSAKAAPNYPDLWWTPVPESELASWEIGPQAADRNQNEVILSKRNELGLLSNFYAASFELQGKKYASVEGFWQAMKYPEGENDPRWNSAVKWKHSRAEVEQMSAFEAKRAGTLASENMKKLKIDWVSFQGKQLTYKGKDQQAHYDLIYAATVAKIQQNPDVKAVLLKTKGLKLLPDHHQDENLPPAYRYYDIAMAIRDSLPIASAQDGNLWCLSKHLEDSIVINEARKPVYAAMTENKSIAVSETLIQFERDLFFVSRLSDYLAYPFQKWGHPVWCDDVVEMTEIPSQQFAPTQKPDPKTFIHYDVKDLQSRLYKSLFPGGLEKLKIQAHKELNDLSFEPRYHCMTRHFLESIVRFVQKSEFWTRWMTFLSVVAQIHHLKTTHTIDQLSMAIQSEGVEIICRDVPALL